MAVNGSREISAQGSGGVAEVWALGLGSTGRELRETSNERREFF